MTPQLSIVYNSSSKEGLLGYGFDLSGLSLINRTPQNYHVDGRVTAVDFSVNDRFMLDGQRLIRISPSTQTQNIEYRTENNTFSKIVAKGSQSDPEEFTVYTKSGLTYVYTSNRSKLKASNGSGTVDYTLFWLLKTVTDTKGNYFEISYDQNVKDGESSEYWPIRIDYTGNAGLAPYASIRFKYTNIDPTDTYIHGAAVRKSKLMKSIEIYSGEKRVKYYDLSYKKNLNANLLESVTEVASDGKKLNPTTFNWSIADNFRTTEINKAIAENKSFKNTKICFGDFDGDGRTDFILLAQSGASWKGTKYYENAGYGYAGFKSPILLTGLIEEPDDAVVGDFNGDGLSDLVLRKGKNLYVYLASVDSKKTLSFALIKTIVLLEDKDGIYLSTGDFNGDGISDLFYCYKKPLSSGRYTGNRPLTSGIYLSNPTASSSDILGDVTKGPSGLNEYAGGRRDPVSVKIENIEFLDFNGDGLTDIIYVYKDKSVLHVTESPNSLSYSTIIFKNPKTLDFLKYTSPEKLSDRKTNYILGDFNGDGKSDLMVLVDKLWYTYTSNGIDYIKSNAIPNSAQIDADKYIFYIADLNKDGLDDLYAVKRDPADTNQNFYFINNGKDKGFTKSNSFYGKGVENVDFYFLDINNDGIPDVFRHDSRSSGGYDVLYTNSNDNNLMKSITDGLGNLTEITYVPLAYDERVYTKTATAKYPLSIITPNWPVVSKVYQNNGVGGKFEKTYQYKNLYLHRLGRGIIGFEYFTETEPLTYTVTTSQFEIQPKEYVSSLKSTEVKVIGYPLSQTTSNNKLRYYYDKVFTYDVTNTVEKKYEINTQKEYSSISTRSVFDDYGNITRSVVKYSANDSVINENKYEKDNISKWYLGRLSESTVTKVNPKGTVKRISRFDYDPASGLLVKEEVEPGNSLGYVKTYVHDKFGDITSSTTTPNNPKYKPRTKKSVYDSQGRFEEQSIDNLGFVVKRTIDKDLGLVKTETDPNGLTTEYIYDSFGRTEYSKTPLGNSHSLILWSKGHPDAPANAVYFTYNEVSGSPATIEFFDGLGRSLRKKAIGFDGTSIYVDALYNAKGEQYKSSEPYFPGNTVYWNQSEYDAIGRVTKQIYPDNTIILILMMD